MEQLLCHLVGDYWLQNDWMATYKKKYFWIALVHSMVYTIPFILLTQNALALFIICISHAVIDGTNIVNRLYEIKNWKFTTTHVIDRSVVSTHNKKYYVVHHPEIPLKDGYGDRPLFIRIWLTIIQDNILHLVINYLVLRYLCN